MKKFKFKDGSIITASTAEEAKQKHKVIAMPKNSFTDEDGHEFTKLKKEFKKLGLGNRFKLKGDNYYGPDIVVDLGKFFLNDDVKLSGRNRQPSIHYFSFEDSTAENWINFVKKNKKDLDKLQKTLDELNKNPFIVG